jgi:type I restriction enzyme S subunit
MNSLNFMERLLDGVAVEWKPLGEVCSVGVGQAPKNNEIGEYSFVNAGTTPSGYLPDYNTGSDTITTPSRGQGGIGYVGYQSRKFWCGPLCYRIRSTSETVLTRFLFHVMSNRTLEIIGLANMTGVPALNRKELVGFPIPIPCPENPEKSIEIQTEIVRILDTFTELTAELTARKKQYSYYREQLLTFDLPAGRQEGQMEWKALGDVCSSITAGGDLPENHVKGQIEPTDEFPYPIYANATGDKGLYGFTDEYKIESDAVTISARGAKIGYHTVREGKFTSIIRLITLVPNKNVISTRYLNYVLDITPIGGTDGGIPQLTVPTVMKISIPVPTATEQARIVAILDKFDALSNSITEGLPREIELRQKQYEYYRNMLLSFPKPETNQTRTVS